MLLWYPTPCSPRVIGLNRKYPSPSQVNLRDIGLQAVPKLVRNESLETRIPRERSIFHLNSQHKKSSTLLTGSGMLLLLFYRNRRYPARTSFWRTMDKGNIL
jgi:hypothetical protein